MFVAGALFAAAFACPWDGWVGCVSMALAFCAGWMARSAEERESYFATAWWP